MSLETMKAAARPFKWFIVLVLCALVLIWFWHPFWHFIQEIASKADKLF